MIFCESRGNPQYPASFSSCSTETNGAQQRCTVTPPTLKAASPVGAAKAQRSVLCLSFHMAATWALMASIRKDFPVPPTPLTNICSGCNCEHSHKPHSCFFWWRRWSEIRLKTCDWSAFNIAMCSSVQISSAQFARSSCTSFIASCCCFPNSLGATTVVLALCQQWLLSLPV